MSYTILYRPATEKQLSRLDSIAFELVRDAISDLADEPRPHGCKKLKGRDEYRIRVGEYRIVYEIHDRVLTIIVVKIGHRKDIYRR